MAPSGYYVSDAGTTTSGTWTNWNVKFYSCGTASTSSTGDSVWYEWNQYYSSGSGTTTVAADYTWTEWNGEYFVFGDAGGVPQYQAAQETPEQIAERARLAREEEDRLLRLAAEQRRIAEEADARAEALLKANLSQQQQLEFEKEKSFTVISKDGQRRYRVKKGWSHNVERLDGNGRRIQTMCAHPTERVPDYDNMLAQKLMLEHNEEGFLKMANKQNVAVPA